MKPEQKKFWPLWTAAAVLAISVGIFFLAGWNAPDSSMQAGVSTIVSSQGDDSSLPASSGEEESSEILLSDEETSSKNEPSPEEAESSETTTSSKETTDSRPNSRPTSSQPVLSHKPQNPESSIPTPTPTPSENGKYVVGYYASWARGSGLPAQKVQASMLTHLNYAFADVGSDGQLRLPNSETDKKNFSDLRELKKNNPHLKTLISIGGWDYSSNFSTVASSASKREVFAQSCADFIIEHGFDGIDIDWEFPSSSDRQNFTLLLQAVRSKLNTLGKQNSRSYYLTIAYSPSQSIINRIEAQTVSSLVDYIFLMGYDLHGPWDSFADLNAPIYSTGESSPHYTISLSDAVQSYKNAGVPMSKLVLGMPFYGYQYATTGERWNGLYSPFSSAKSVSFDNIVKNLLPNTSFKQYFHDAARVPYLYDGVSFVSYDDESSIAEKTQFAMSNGLAGVGAWELSQDKNAVLLSSAYRTLYGK